MSAVLTKRQREVLSFVEEFLSKNGYCPSLEEIARGVGLSSIATVHVHLRHLEEKKALRRVLGPRITLTGNLDPANAVMKSTPDRIHAAFRTIYEEVGNPYFVNAGCEIPVETPIENLRAVCEPIEAQ